MASPWLTRALEESRARGFLGPGSIEPHIEHAQGFATAYEDRRGGPPGEFLDLGSGGGLPGFVLLERWDSPGTLLDSMVRRTSFLEEALTWPGAPSRAQVVTARAEEAARDPHFEARYPLVVVRSFGPPAVVAECASRFLAQGGLLVVSEPPSADEDRWPVEDLVPLGLAPIAVVRSRYSYEVLERVGDVDPRYPRRSGLPTRRPLF